jgi:hypothetical protein
MRRLMVAAVLIGLLPARPSLVQDPPPLALEAKIPLGTVNGRSDLFAFDADRQLLFVAMTAWPWSTWKSATSCTALSSLGNSIICAIRRVRM